jgi:hypothetical protein
MFVHVRATSLQNGEAVKRYDLDVRVANWHQMLSTTNDPNAFHNLVNALEATNPGGWGPVSIELVLEHVRTAEFGNLPSRLQCAFAGADELSALRFAFTYRASMDSLFYEVAPLGDLFFADMALVNRGYERNLPPATALDRQHARARAYWSSVTPDPREVIISEALLVGGATVVRQLTLHGPF